MVNKMDIIKKLAKYGLEKREAEVYLTLLTKGNLTPLALSRETGMNRTTLYRVVEKLVTLGVVKKGIGYKSTSFEASPAENLKILVHQKEIELKEMQKEMPEVIQHLEHIPKETTGPTKVFYHHGASGLRQLLWNTLSAKTEVVGYGYGDWNKGVGKRFAEKLRFECVERNRHSRELQNENQHTKEPFTENSLYLAKHYKLRVISRDVLIINHDTYIYDDVFAFYHYFRGELFGVEIHNGEIAKTQKQIFEILWKQAKKAE